MRPIVIIFSVIIFLSIIPIPYELFGVNLEGYLFLISLPYLNYNRIGKIYKRLFVFLLIFILYYIIFLIWDLMFDKEVFSLLHLLKIILLFLMAISLNNTNEILFIIRSLLIAILISSIIGFLIFIFGEPFAGFRKSLYLDLTGFVFYSQGMRIAGLSKTLFTFSYQLSILPLILLFFYQKNKSKLYLSLMFFSIIIILLNGERSSLIFPALAMFFLLKKWSKSYVQIAAITFFIGLSGFLVLNSEILNIKGNSIERLFGGGKSSNEYRLLKQVAAVKSVFNNPITGGNQLEYRKVMIEMTNWDPHSSAHNSYIRVAENIGVIGFFLVFIFFKELLILSKKTLKKYKFSADIKLVQLLVYSLMSVTLVGFFHNDGFFAGERISVILLSLLISMYYKPIEIKRTSLI